MDSEKARILIVEDEIVIGALLQELFEDAGFQVKVCETGGEALEAQSSNPADLIIIDYGLPDQNGLDVCQKLSPAPNGRRPHTILATGWGMLEVSQYEHLVDVLLEKPFNMSALVKQVEGLLAS